MKKVFTLIKVVYLIFTVVVVVLLITIVHLASKVAVSPSTNIGVVQNQHEAATTTHYTIDISYPASVPEIATYVADQKKSFIDSFSEFTPEDLNVMGLTGERRWNLYITTVATTSSRTTSYIVQVYTYTGGAHGITVYHSFTYDKKGARISLENIFKKDFNFYPILSQKAKAYFSQKFPNGEAGQINEGTAPKPENFATWYITNSDIVFVFQQYSIGPYSLGLQEFPLPKESIKDVLIENM